MEALDRLCGNFRKLPGVGAKTALRYAYRVIDMTEEEAEEFISAVKEAKEKIRLCKECGQYSEDEICDICKTRDKSVICVVKSPKDIAAIERAGFKGVYHVLHNTLDFQRGIGVDDIRAKELFSRLIGVREVVLALNSDTSGEITSTYLARELKGLGIKVTRLASGIPLGAELEFADEGTLKRAYEDRKEV